ASGRVSRDRSTPHDINWHLKIFASELGSFRTETLKHNASSNRSPTDSSQLHLTQLNQLTTTAGGQAGDGVPLHRHTSHGIVFHQNLPRRFLLMRRIFNSAHETKLDAVLPVLRSHFSGLFKAYSVSLITGRIV